MEKKILTIIAVIVCCGAIIGAVYLNKLWKNNPENNNSQKTITVYAANNEIIAQYKGNISIQSDTDNCIRFIYNNKKYVYYNCSVEVITDVK